MLPYSPLNRQRGEVLVTLGGQSLRLCVTLRSLSQLESYFSVHGLEALGARLSQLSANDLVFVLQTLCIDDVAVEGLNTGLHEALAALVAAFEAMNEAT